MNTTDFGWTVEDGNYPFTIEETADPANFDDICQWLVEQEANPIWEEADYNENGIPCDVQLAMTKAFVAWMVTR